MKAGGAPLEWAERERRAARKGVRRKVLAWLGLNAAARRADALAVRAKHGAVAEEWTAALPARLGARVPGGLTSRAPSSPFYSLTLYSVRL